MSLTKSLLLGSAAGIVAVSAAQAADLPTRKGPVAAEYVRVCSITVAGAPIVGFVLPGSDTCFKISGYITGQIEGGNVKQGYSVGYTTPVFNKAGTVIGQTSTQALSSAATTRDTFGYTTRFNLTFDAVSNTAYGPLVAHGEYQFNHGGGFGNAGTGGSDGGLNRAYVTWAGLTAGKANSFFSFTGGGLAWYNFYSPDRQGFNQPDLLAYTASFGGGFAATISIEDPYNGGANGASAGGTPISSQGSYQGTYGGYLGSATELGLRVPDIVGALSVKQSWGSAQISGVGHNIRAASTYGAASSIDKWGFGIDAGVSFNIPSLPGSMVGITGAWTRNAAMYSGLNDGMNGEAGQQVSGNGQADSFADAFYNGNGTWATPTAWSVAGYAQFAVSPTVTLGVEGSYAQINWSGLLNPTVVSNSKSFIVGGVAHYDPVKNLDFEFELLYESTNTAVPSGYIASTAAGVTNGWVSKSDGFQARMQVTRNF
jgi:hypothetical protein